MGDADFVDGVGNILLGLDANGLFSSSSLMIGSLVKRMITF